jgi:hypothetical protein
LVMGGFMVDLLGAQGVYGFGAVMACVAAVILVPVMRSIRDQPATEAGGGAEAGDDD